jgi:surfeit locus 1 family protein
MLTAVGIALFLGFVALGAWQVQRLSWKLDLIERVDQRLKAPPQPLPPPVQWPEVTAAAYEYQPVRLQGQWLADKTVLTQATTALGAGYWVLTPLQTSEGTQVLVNRGFVPQDQRARWQGGAGADTSASTPATVVGLLRMSEPGGGFLRSNDPAQQRWHSRDVAAIAQALLRMSEPGGGFLRSNDPAQQRWHSRDVAAIAQALQLARPAPFFVDAGLPSLKDPASADLPPAQSGPWPREGLTVVRFSNSHLVYALTWFGLALMVVGAAVVVARYESRLRAAYRSHTTHEPQHIL